MEQYIDGRELYVGVLGNERLRVLPVWELRFTDMPQGALPIATQRVKLDPKYQESRGIVTGPAKDISPELRARFVRYAKRICRTLQLDGYCRIDFRLAEDGTPYFIEANPIPDIAKSEEFVEAAGHDGIDPLSDASEPHPRARDQPGACPRGAALGYRRRNASRMKPRMSSRLWLCASRL